MSWAYLGDALDRQSAGASQKTKDAVGNIVPTVLGETVRAATGSGSLGAAADSAARLSSSSEAGKERLVRLVDCCTLGLGSVILDKILGE